jgi:hypothetical protein
MSYLVFCASVIAGAAALASAGCAAFASVFGASIFAGLDVSPYLNMA